MEITSTPAESSSFRALSPLKLYTGLQYHIDSDVRQTSKNFEFCCSCVLRVNQFRGPAPSNDPQNGWGEREKRYEVYLLRTAHPPPPTELNRKQQRYVK
jgi:hypothetical protein